MVPEWHIDLARPGFPCLPIFVQKELKCWNESKLTRKGTRVEVLYYKINSFLHFFDYLINDLISSRMKMTYLYSGPNKTGIRPTRLVGSRTRLNPLISRPRKELSQWLQMNTLNPKSRSKLWLNCPQSSRKVINKSKSFFLVKVNCINRNTVKRSDISPLLVTFET